MSLQTKLGKKSDGLGNNKKRQEAIGAIGALAGDLQKLTNAHNALAKIIQKEIDGTSDRLDDISIVLQALSTIVGIEKVNEAAKNIRIEISEKDIQAQEQAVAGELQKGTLKKIEAVTETCLVVTTVVRADGSQVYPRKSYLPLKSFKPEIQAILKDKKIGDKFELPTGAGTMEVLEIYEEVPAKEETPQETPPESK